jgi:hypothetical protein
LVEFIHGWILNMPMTESQVEALIKKRDVGDVEEIYGPVRFGGMWLWEIWVDNGTETKAYYETRFLLETESNPVYFDTFVALVGYLNELFIGDESAGRRSRLDPVQGNWGHAFETGNAIRCVLRFCRHGSFNAVLGC